MLDAEGARELLGSSTATAYKALDRLVDDGVLRVAVERKRHRVWVAAAVLDEVENLIDAVAEWQGALAQH